MGVAFRGCTCTSSRSINPSNEQIYAPGAMGGHSAFGYTDMELGAKIAFVKESKYIPQTQYRNVPYGAFLLKYAFGERLELGGEVFSHRSEGYATGQTEASTMIDVGGYYHFKRHAGERFCSAMATRSAAKPNSTRMSACTGHGEKIKRNRTPVDSGFPNQ